MDLNLGFGRVRRAGISGASQPIRDPFGMIGPLDRSPRPSRAPLGGSCPNRLVDQRRPAVPGFHGRGSRVFNRDIEVHGDRRKQPGSKSCSLETLQFMKQLLILVEQQGIIADHLCEVGIIRNTGQQQSLVVAAPKAFLFGPDETMGMSKIFYISSAEIGVGKTRIF